MTGDKIQKKRVLVWEKTDKRENEWAFATIDTRAPDDPPAAPLAQTMDLCQGDHVSRVRGTRS